MSRNSPETIIKLIKFPSFQRVTFNISNEKNDFKIYLLNIWDDVLYICDKYVDVRVFLRSTSPEHDPV